MTSSLFEPAVLANGAAVKNRIVKAAMSEALADSRHNPTGQHTNLYAQWAAGGAGMLITGNVMVDRRYLGEPGNVVLDEQSDMQAFRAWAAAATGHSAVAIMQLNHPGKQMPRGLGRQPIAPSATPLGGELAAGFAPPREMTAGEIQETIDLFISAAARAQEAGFSGVQIHAAHGYLINQFLSPADNRRTDEYGGSFEGRVRFLTEVYAGIRQAVGRDFIIGLKLNATDFSDEGFSFEDCQRVVGLMEEAGLDFVEISGGTYTSPVFREEGSPLLSYAQAIAQQTTLPVISTGGFRQVDAMVEARAEGIDFIGLARPLALNPQLPAQIKDGTQRSWATPRVTARHPALDSALRFLLSISYYEGQMRRIAQGKKPRSTQNALPFLLTSLSRHGLAALRPRRA